jgi:protein DGCR14
MEPSVLKPKILDEDTYLQKMEEIITRDFFPDLPKLRLQAEYIEAVESNDIDRLREVQMKMVQASTRMKTPSTTPFGAMATPRPQAEGKALDFLLLIVSWCGEYPVSFYYYFVFKT